MRALLLPLHLTFVGLWLGCVVTEALFERALLGQGRDKELILAALHKRVDVFIEIPAFALVLATGALLLAIAANIYCVSLVFHRHRHALRGDWPAFERADHLQHKIGAVVLLGILGALGPGLALFAGAAGE